MVKLCYCALAALVGAAIGAAAPGSWRGSELVAAQSTGQPDFAPARAARPAREPARRAD